MGQYVQTLRDRWWVVVIAVLLTTGAAALYVATSEKVYEAEADVLISPVSEENHLLISLGLTSTSGDPLRDTETGARLISSIDTAEAASRMLGGTPAADIPPDELLDSVSVLPVAESSIVSVTAQDSDPDTAAAIANAFAEGAVEERTRKFQTALQTKLTELEQAVAGTNAADPAAAPLFADISELRLLEGQDDPTLSVQASARPPDTPVSPRPRLSIIGGVLAGLVLGIGAAFALRLFDPRLRHEEELQEHFRIPLLARIPRDPGGGTDTLPISPETLSPATTEAYRTLRGTLGVIGTQKANGGRSVLITSASAKEGKSTTALGLASAIADAGSSVIMIEADLRRPELANALDIPEPSTGVVSVLVGNTPMEQALIPAPGVPGLQLLLADHTGPATAELFGLPAAETMVAYATSIADFVVIDSAPMTEVVDSLPLAKIVDDVVVCVRLGRTRLPQISRLAELLVGGHVRPTGFAVIGTDPPESDYYFQSRSSRLGATA